MSLEKWFSQSKWPVPSEERIDMFTGIIEEIGTISGIKKGNESAVLTIACEDVLKDTKIGDSIAVNGVCLTVTSFVSGGYTVDVMAETIDRSSLGQLSVGSRVNLERAMAADGRFGGHIVAGHIDGTGVIRSIEKDETAVWYEIEAPKAIMRYIIEKGSIAIDGISLTVARVEDASFRVSIIPHTQKETTLADRVPGDVVNLENDVIGKYVEKLCGFDTEQKKESKVTMSFLAENGFL